jgi:hypothetical protein
MEFFRKYVVNSDFVDFVSNLPHVRESDSLSIDPVLSHLLYDRLQETLVLTIWGELRHVIGTKFSHLLSGKPLSTLSDDFFVEKFPEEKTKDFNLQSNFKIKISTKDKLICLTLNEGKLYSLIFSDSKLYSAFLKELCTILDVALSLGGSEAIVESYYAVMKSQHQDRGQENETLDVRTLVDWSLPYVIQCPKTIAEIAKMYRSGMQTPLPNLL